MMNSVIIMIIMR